MNRTIQIQPQFTVETCRIRCGDKDEDSQAFYSEQEARDWAYKQLCGYASRVWINGVEFTRRDYK